PKTTSSSAFVLSMQPVTVVPLCTPYRPPVNLGLPDKLRPRGTSDSKEGLLKAQNPNVGFSLRFFQSATIKSPGTMGRVRGSMPRYAADPTSRSVHAKIPSFARFDAGVEGNVFQTTRSRTCDAVAAQTAP